MAKKKPNKPRVPPKRSKVVKPKWATNKPPSKKKGKPSEPDTHDKFLMQSEDGRRWSDMACTDQDHAPEHYEQHGWDRFEDQQVASKKYPKVKR